MLFIFPEHTKKISSKVWYSFFSLSQLNIHHFGHIQKFIESYLPPKKKIQHQKLKD